MGTRYFSDLSQLTAAFAKMAIEAPVMMEASMGAASHTVKRHVDDTFGDKSKLAELAEATMDDRERLGYSRDEPLLRDGSLLKASVEQEHHDMESGVGSAEPVMAYSESGFVNHRSGRSVPPRPVFKIALNESEAEIGAEIDLAVDVLISGRPHRLTP